MISDFEAISRLVYTYAERLDAGDFEGVADLFAHATLRAGGRSEVLRGRDGALAMYRNSVVLYDRSPCTKHVITNLIVDLDAGGRTASARSYFTVLQARPELPLQVVIAGRYHDRFARIGGTWHFTERVFFADLFGDLRFHLKGDPFQR